MTTAVHHICPLGGGWGYFTVTGHVLRWCLSADESGLCCGNLFVLLLNHWSRGEERRLHSVAPLGVAFNRPFVSFLEQTQEFTLNSRQKNRGSTDPKPLMAEEWRRCSESLSVGGQKFLTVLWILRSALRLRPGENPQIRVNMQRKWVYQVLKYVIMSTLSTLPAIISNY